MLEEGKWIYFCQKNGGFCAQGHKLLGICSAGPEQDNRDGEECPKLVKITHLLPRSLWKIWGCEEPWR